MRFADHTEFGVAIMKKHTIEPMAAEKFDSAEIDAVEKLHLLAKITQAEAQLARGEGVDHETVLQRLCPWLA